MFVLKVINRYKSSTQLCFCIIVRMTWENILIKSLDSTDGSIKLTVSKLTNSDGSRFSRYVNVRVYKRYGEMEYPTKEGICFLPEEFILYIDKIEEILAKGFGAFAEVKDERVFKFHLEDGQYEMMLERKNKNPQHLAGPIEDLLAILDCKQSILSYQD